MAFVIHGRQTSWNLQRDKDGHRDYKIKFLLRTTDPLDGPAAALKTAGLPVPGNYWKFDNDVDEWAYCRQECTVNPVNSKEPNLFFEAEFTFSTRNDDKSCKQNQIESPLLTPDEISGGYKSFHEEATVDRFGNTITNSAHEQMRGHQNEWDANRPFIKIKKNVPSLGLEIWSQMIDCVNAYQLWGLPRRTIKLSNVTWSRKFYGTCFVYYEISYEFDIRYRRMSVLSEEPGTIGSGTAPNVGVATCQVCPQGAPVIWTLTGVPGGPVNLTYNSGCVWEGGIYSLSADNNYDWNITDGVNSWGIIANLWTCQGPNDLAAAPGSSPETITITAATATTTAPGARLIGKYETFDRDLLDEGTKVLNGHWNKATKTWVLDNIGGGSPDPSNPAHFIRFQDLKGNMTKVILDGAGKPYNPKPGVIIFDCSECPLGAPSVWTVTGLNNGASVTLNHTAGCEWGTIGTGSDPYTLIIDGDEWVLTNETTLQEWVLTTELWSCLGPNAMFSPVGVTGPDSITVTVSSSSSKPGMRHVEKYGEADFLVLGIPTTF